MAKEKVNKSQAVRDYVRANRQATNKEVADALTKKGIEVTANYVATIKTKAKAKRLARKAAAPAAPETSAPAAAPAAVKPGDTITIDQIKKVAQTVKTIGGFARLHEMLAVIKEVGGPKKFKDLLEAMAATEKDAIPF